MTRLDHFRAAALVATATGSEESWADIVADALDLADLMEREASGRDRPDAAPMPPRPPNRVMSPSGALA